MTKEQIYDSQIAPLMSQIIEICKEHKIANICSFSLDDEGLCCTTCMTQPEFDPPDEFRECVRVLYKQNEPLLMTIRDADGTVKESHAFLG